MIAVEADRRSSCFFGGSTESDDSKYLCQFTALLLDTVEELTMRVSQIEFVCHQQFPDLQSLSNAIQKKLKGSTNQDLEWKKKEDSLLHQIQLLQIDNKHSEEEIDRLRASLDETEGKLMNNEGLLNNYRSENINLKQNEGIISGLREQLMQKVGEAAKADERGRDLRQQIELKDKKLEEEHQKRRSLFGECSRLKESYKRLKSQYTFLISKLGEGRTAMDTGITEDEKDIKINVEETTMNFLDPKKSKLDGVHPTPCTDDGSCTPPSTSHAFLQAKTKPPPSPKSKRPACVKHAAAPHWRDTRAGQEPREGDPHDDFLDTPLENLRNFNAKPPAGERSPVSGEEDTRDENRPGVQQGKRPAPAVGGASGREVKCVEPVRRKVERDGLKGVECLQCRKFYDAVLPKGDRNGCGERRCEHHDGVSRHRYRHAPPLTPEGFWNIGFDSDL